MRGLIRASMGPKRYDRRPPLASARAATGVWMSRSPETAIVTIWGSRTARVTLVRSPDGSRATTFTA